MIQLLVVSHSHALARAAVELAGQMVPERSGPVVRVAAGLDDGSLGTDAAAIAEALAEMDNPEGTLVLLDLGSAVLSTEMALEFLDPEVAARVRISPAPLVEGLVGALVCAAGGADLDRVDAEARAALAAKISHLGGGRTLPVEHPIAVDEVAALRVELRGAHGLHARPAAALVTALVGLDARVLAGREADALVDAHSMSALAGLGIRRGEQLELHFAGPDAAVARSRVEALAADDFGERDEGHPVATQPLPADADALPVHELSLVLPLPVSGYRKLDDEQEQARLQEALGVVDDFLVELAGREGANPTEQTVLAAVRTLLHDPSLGQGFAQAIAAGRGAAEAVDATMTATAATFEAMANPLFRERAADLRVLRRLVIATLLGLPLALPELPAGHRLLVDELDAVLATQLDPARTPVVLTRAPGQQGHGVLVARSKGIAVQTGAS